MFYFKSTVVMYRGKITKTVSLSQTLWRALYLCWPCWSVTLISGRCAAWAHVHTWTYLQRSELSLWKLMEDIYDMTLFIWPHCRGQSTNHSSHSSLSLYSFPHYGGCALQLWSKNVHTGFTFYSSTKRHVRKNNFRLKYFALLTESACKLCLYKWCLHTTIN